MLREQKAAPPIKPKRSDWGRIFSVPFIAAAFGGKMDIMQVRRLEQPAGRWTGITFELELRV